MSTPALDERRRDVLRQLIDLHILTGEPVGSESLARALNRAVSSATLRNIMADLEALGFLNHPHTSAGRMPTDEGYRLYVDSLMEARPLPADARPCHPLGAARRVPAAGAGEGVPPPVAPVRAGGLRARSRFLAPRPSGTSTSCASPIPECWW